MRDLCIFAPPSRPKPHHQYLFLGRSLFFFSLVGLVLCPHPVSAPLLAHLRGRNLPICCFATNGQIYIAHSTIVFKHQTPIITDKSVPQVLRGQTRRLQTRSEVRKTNAFLSENQCAIRCFCVRSSISGEEEIYVFAFSSPPHLCEVWIL